MKKDKIIFPDDDSRWNYVRGAFPKNKADARECWEQISCLLAEETLWEDGELTQVQSNRKEREVLQDAKLLYTRFQCPRDIASDADLSQFTNIRKGGKK